MSSKMPQQDAFTFDALDELGDGGDVNPKVRVSIPIVAQAAPAAPSWQMPKDVEGKIERAERVLTNLLAKGMPVCVSWSAGKDSSTVLNLLLSAAAKLSAQGVALPPIVVTHADTMIENPEMVLYARNEMVQVREFARSHKLDVHIEISTPNLTDQWAVRVIGGRALPPFPGTNRDCSMDWKASPMKKLRKSVLKRLKAHCAAAGSSEPLEPVILLGTRYDESAERSRNMRERGESDIEIRRGIDENGKPSHLFLSPIAYWDSDDVWEYLGTARAGAIHAYSNFEDTFRVYSDAMGTSCVIVAEDMSKSMKASKACGARHGCSLCTAVGKDQSMENMLSFDDRYAYMRGLNELRNFLAATRWDTDRRSWLGRTIKDGYVRISPDAYSPSMMEELLRYALTIDLNERHAASAAGLARPRFQLINLEQLFAIDAMWSLQAYHRPFHALKIYQDVVEKGERYPVPLVDTFPRLKEMPAKYLFVGADWEDGHQHMYTGLRSVMHDLVKRDGDGCMDLRRLKDGREVLAVNTGKLMSIDPEAAYLLLDFEMDRLMADHDNPRVGPTAAYFYYISLGMLEIKSGMESEVDSILRRSAWKERQGVAGQVDPATLMDRAVTAAEAGMVASTNGKLRKRGSAGSKSVAHASLMDGEGGEDDLAVALPREEEEASDAANTRTFVRPKPRPNQRSA